MNIEGKIIALASDHAGFLKKQVIIKFLQENNIPHGLLFSRIDHRTAGRIACIVDRAH